MSYLNASYGSLDKNGGLMWTAMDWHPNYSRCRFAWVGVVSVPLGVSKSVSVVSYFDLFDGNLIGLYKIKLLSWSDKVPRHLTLMCWTRWKLLSLIQNNLIVTV